MSSRSRMLHASLVVVASSLAAGCGSRAEPAVHTLAAELPSIATGKVHGWAEATQHLRIELGEDDAVDDDIRAELGDPRPAGLDAFWSIASTRPGAGFFYSDAVRGTSETRIAYAAAATRVSDIRDASSLAFTRESVGPVPVGGIVVIQHEPSRRYLALVIDGIEPTNPWDAGAGPYALADVTWYLTPPGASDFSSVP